jgi:hypothetical protein
MSGLDGKVAFLVANAGGSFTATFLTIKSILPGMKERKAGNNCIAPETILTERNRQRVLEGQQQALLDTHPRFCRGGMDHWHRLRRCRRSGHSVDESEAAEEVPDVGEGGTIPCPLS